VVVGGCGLVGGLAGGWVDWQVDWRTARAGWLGGCIVSKGQGRAGQVDTLSSLPPIHPTTRLPAPYLPQRLPTILRAVIEGEGLGGLPLYAFGVSSGGGIVLRLAQVMPEIKVGGWGQ